MRATGRTMGRLGMVVVAAAVLACGGGRTHTARPLTSSSDATIDPNEGGPTTYARVEELIQARAPGVQVMRRDDGNFSLRIRGTGSFSGGNEPLVVIDGMPVAARQMTQELAALNPRDVLQIEVLKDAASTAEYGVRGANGVIVIRTRRE